MEFLEIGQINSENIYTLTKVPIASKQYMYLGVLVDGMDFMKSDRGVVYCRSTMYMADSSHGWQYNHERLKYPLIRKEYLSFEQSCLRVINSHIGADKVSNKDICKFKEDLKRVYDEFDVSDYWVDK